jgi:hypothetical protein
MTVTNATDSTATPAHAICPAFIQGSVVAIDTLMRSIPADNQRTQNYFRVIFLTERRESINVSVQLIMPKQPPRAFIG